jgi:hypothetical protein
VNWGNGSWSVYAEGPLSIWLRVSGDPDDFEITGGLGLLDAVFEALGAAAEAVGEAIVAAAEAVADALEDLGNAILDFGNDVLQWVDGILTDIADLASDVFDEVSSWFETERTRVIDKTAELQATYSITRVPNRRNRLHQQCERHSTRSGRRQWPTDHRCAGFDRLRRRRECHQGISSLGLELGAGVGRLASA